MAFMTLRWPYWSLFALLGACAGTSTHVAPVARADLACDQVQVTELGDNRYEASGCGRRGLYAELCSGGSCSWVRVRSREEIAASSGGHAPAPAASSELVGAPPPAQREIIAAPPPQQREVIPAPPPATQADGAPTAQPAAPPPAADAGQQQPFTPQATPLSDGQLSDPYQTEIPAQPIAQRAEYPPPAPLVEDRPPPPAPTYIWVGGYWWWGNPLWTWVPGYWCPPRVGYRYVASSWYWSGGLWWFGPGGWARPGSTLIVYNVAPRPQRVAVVRSFTPYRVSSAGRAPARMGVTAAPRAISPAPVGGGRMGVTSAGGFGRAASPAPRTFAPQSSPLYRYPTATTRPVRSERFGSTRIGNGSSMGGASGYRGAQPGPAPAPRRFGTTPSSSPSGYRGGSFSRMPSGPAPVPHSSSIAPVTPSPRPSGAGPAPMRVPSMSRMPSSGVRSSPAPLRSSPAPARAPSMGRSGSMGRRD